MNVVQFARPLLTSPLDVKPCRISMNEQRNATTWFYRLGAGVIIYLLSIGPVTCCCANSGVPWRVVEYLYYPVISVCDNAPPQVNDTLFWYLKLWGVN